MDSLYSWKAILTREPAAIAAAVGALLSAGAAFLPISTAASSALTAALFAALGLFVRSRVTPVAMIEDESESFPQEVLDELSAEDDA